MVGLIGVGLLGSAIAERLLAGGYKVCGYDVNAKCRERLAGLGGAAAGSATAVVEACERIILSLPNSGVVAQVLDVTRPTMRPGLLVIDTSTGDPEAVRGFARQLAQSGISYLDATVGGSSRQVREGDAIVMVGGEEDAYHRCADLFSCFSRQAFHLGPPGSGSLMKLVFNLVMGLNRAVLAEGLAFAEACGVRADAAMEVLKAGTAYSRVMDIKGGKMLARDFTPEARLSQHLKDVGLILATGEQNGARLPLSAVHRELLEALERAGHGGEDNSAVIRAFLKDR